jgi:hypothetical protein
MTTKTHGDDDQVQIEALEKSANELLATTEKMTNLVKGFSLDSGSVADERGEHAISQPGAGDLGAVEQLMIVGRAKAAKALKESGFTDEQVGKLIAKMFGDPEEDDETAKSERGSSAPLAKSEIDKAISEALAKSGKTDVAPILKDVMATAAHAIDRTRADHGAFAKAQTGFNSKLAKAVVELGRELRKSQAAQAASQATIDALAKKLNVTVEQIERVPVVSPRATTGAAPLAKSNADGTQPPKPGQVPEKLTRHQLASVLSYMAMQKSMKLVAGEDTLVKSSLIIGGGTVEPHTVEAVMHFLHAHPTEVNRALTYNDRA